MFMSLAALFGPRLSNREEALCSINSSGEGTSLSAALEASLFASLNPIGGSRFIAVGDGENSEGMRVYGRAGEGERPCELPDMARLGDEKLETLTGVGRRKLSVVALT